MKIEKIKQIVEDYDSLYLLALDKCEILSTLSTKYAVIGGVTDIQFHDDVVYVKFDDDKSFYTFPIEWLSLDDNELRATVKEN